MPATAVTRITAHARPDAARTGRRRASRRQHRQRVTTAVRSVSKNGDDAIANSDESTTTSSAAATKYKPPTKDTLPPRDRRFRPLTPPPPASEFPAYEARDFFRYELVHQSSKSAARVGRIHTPHGIIDTPGFVAVGTNGALKAVPHHELAAAGIDLMFSNTYHLMLQPGPETIASGGGLHSFIGRPNGPIITDSGGFQVFSLARPTADDGLEMKSRRPSKQKGDQGLLIRTNEHGVLFKSYRDGTPVALTPESSVEAQKQLGADIIIPLDEVGLYKLNAVDPHSLQCMHGSSGLYLEQRQQTASHS
jgi:queuine tRNA-ribosyltransferase